MTQTQPQQPELPRSECRSCKAPAVWAHTETGAMMVDYEPSSSGNIELTYERGRWRARVLAKAELELLAGEGLVLRTSHFATCPNADQHRRRRPAP